MNKNRQSDNQPAQWHTLSDDLMNLGTGKRNSQPEQEAGTGQGTYGRSSPGLLHRTSMDDRGSSHGSGTITMTNRKHPNSSKDEEDSQIGRKKKSWSAIAAVVCTVLLLTGGAMFAYFNVHLWADATCTTARTCRICGKTEGRSLGHHWVKTDCVSPRTCSTCGEVSNQAAGHIWIPATCTTPKTCSACGTTQGETAPHTLTTNTYNDYSHSKVETEEVCTQCGRVIKATSADLTTLLDSQQKRFLLPAYCFYQRLLYGAPAFDMLGGIFFDIGTADTSQLGEKAEGMKPPITINVFDGDTQCGTFYFGNLHGEYVTEWDMSIDTPFNCITLAMDVEEASTKYPQLPMLFIAACDPTMKAGAVETMLLAMTAFSGEGGVEHNGIYYSRVGGFFRATCAGALS